MPVWDRNGPRLVEAPDYRGTAAALARCKWLVAYIQTSDREYAGRVSGLSANAYSRILDIMCRNGHLGDSDRSGRPPVYNDAMMEVAFHRVANDTTGKMTGKSLVKDLKHEGHLHLTADVRRFLQHFKLYVKMRGHTLLTNYRKTTFYLSPRDITLRLAFSNKQLELLSLGYLPNFVFEDEVTVEESPHPKGAMDWEPVKRDEWDFEVASTTVYGTLGPPTKGQTPARYGPLGI